VTTDEQQEQQAEEEGEVQTSVIDPKFKKSMDKYYKFMKKYAKFMKKYQNSDNQIAMMSDYTELLSEYTEWVDAIDSVDEDDLNDAELAYYIDIQAKVSKLLLELE
ncbi:MAG: hypothetical protein J6P61_09115, partial [Erysipelotrichaceae bacterium]|nr:hypothetical protein [Erysipelotrichaceae bacterium]